jgi:NADH-quinone oxidoreductase subunit J
VAILIFYALMVVGYYVARFGVAAAGRETRLFTVLAGAIVMVATAFYFGYDLQRMSDVLRYGLSAVAVVAAVNVVTGEKPVHCALSLLAVFLALAGVFVTYQAEFLGVIFVSINAGAVIVSFLFILMLIDLRLGQSREVSAARGVATTVIAAAVAAVLLAAMSGPGNRTVGSPPSVYFAYQSYGAGIEPTRLGEPTPEEEQAARMGLPHPLRPISGTTRALGWELYTRYSVPFEVASLILTVAVVGAVTLGRSPRRDPTKGDA